MKALRRVSGLSRVRLHPKKRKGEMSGARRLDLRRSFARNLRRLRVARGLSQAELAATAGMTRAHLNRLEHGAYNASLDTVSKLATALGVKLLDLLK
jgi:ribosome-binding protein aMBF1 (putative translation factor)